MTTLTDSPPTVPVVRAEARHRRARTGALGFGLPAAIILVAVAIYPLVVLFRMSVSDVGPSNIIGHWDFVGLSNFSAALTDPLTWLAVGRTLGVSVVLLVSNLILGFIAASVLSTPGRLTNIVLGVMVFVWALPPLVGGSVWKFLLNDTGPVNAALGLVGIQPVSWLSDPALALWIVSCVIAWASLPFSTLIQRGGMMAISADILEAAAIDGAGYWTTQLRMVLPLIRPTLWILAILTVIYSFKSFDFFYVLTQGGPGTATNTLPVLAYYTAFNQFNMSTGATVAVLSMVIVAVFAVPYVRTVNAEVERMISGPIRGVFTVIKVLLGLAYLIPLLWIVITSFKNGTQVLQDPNGLIFTPTLSTYSSVIGSSIGAILTSLQIAVAVTLAVIVIGVPASFALARRISPRIGRIITVGLAALLVLQMIPQPMTVIPLYSVLARWHLLGTLFGLILADIAVMLPFAIMLLRPFAMSIPTPLYEAAQIDGAGRWRSFRSITVPMMANGVFTVMSIVFITTWGEFIYAINFLPEGTVLPVSGLLASQNTTYAANWNTLMALAVLTSLPLLVVFLFSQKRLINGLSLGAVK